MHRRTLLKTALASIFLPHIQAASVIVSDSAGLVSALSQAQAGDVITLRGGIYANKATYWASPLRQCAWYLNKAVTLQAAPGELPILTYVVGSPPIQDTSDYGPIVLCAAAVTLRGLSIVGTHALGDSPGGQDTDVAVMVNNGASVVLDGCTVAGFGHAGVKAITGGATITNSTIAGGGFTTRDHGVYLSAGSGQTITHSVFTGCAGYGVHLYGTPSGGSVSDTLITDCAGGGILLGGNGGHTVTRNRITGNRGYGGLVLWKAQSVGNVISDNLITGNTTDITLDQAVAPQTVTGNTYGTIWTNTDYSGWAQ